MSAGTIIDMGNEYQVDFAYRKTIVEAIKLIPGRRFDYRDKKWMVPKTSHDHLVRFAKMNRFEFGMQASNEPQQYDVAPEMPELTIDIPLKREMFPFQRTGVAYNLLHKRVIVGDQPGLGKSTTAFATIIGAEIMGHQALPCLIICPSSLKINWQREIDQYTFKKAMILNDSVKTNFFMYHQAGLADFFIVNFESLKKYFVEKIDDPGKGKPLRLNHIHFKKWAVNFFKAVIIDESHRCMTYDTEIFTGSGMIKIGDIVENKMENLFAMSCDLSSGKLSLNRIVNFWKNERGSREIIKVVTDKGWFTATQDHKVYCACGRKKVLSDVKSGDLLPMVQDYFYHKESGKVDSSLLLKVLCSQIHEQPGSREENTSAKNSGDGDASMSDLQNRFHSPSSEHQKVLRQVVLSEVESESASNDSIKQVSREKGKESIGCNQPNEESGTSQNAFRENEIFQPDEESFSSRENETEYEGENVFIPGREWSAYSSTDFTNKRIESFAGCNGVPNTNSAGEEIISITSQLLQSGHCLCSGEDCDRGGWTESQNKEVEVFGQKENRNIEFARVVSIEVYQQGGVSGCEGSSDENKFVYDIEVEGNHNYFANGFLVSNCKSIRAQQTKFTKGICTGKEWVLALTGTPVINKPKDLISQLGIIDQFKAFGGYSAFVNRYCSGPKEASNLKELNYKLNTTCFYRRDKSDVMKDLPPKTRQVVLCDISTRKEYHDAEKDLEEYLRKYKEATDEQIRKSMKGEVMVRIGTLKNIAARGKFKEVIEFIDDLIESGEKLVLFGHLKEVLGKFKTHYPDAVSITGEDSGSQRQFAVDKFQNNPECKLIICSIQAAGVGLTLTASSQVAFIELGWHPAIHDQCEDRCHRIGQYDNVTCTYFLGKDTIDEWVYGIIQDKRAMTNEVTGAVNDVEENIIDKVWTLFNQPKDAK